MLLYNSAICDLLRESIQMMKWILLGNFLCLLRKTTPPKKLFREFSSMGKVSHLAGKFMKREKKFCGLSKQTRQSNVSPCLLVKILPFSPIRNFARGCPIRLPEVTFGISRARAISLEHKNTMFKYIKTLKCGQTKNIDFTKHDIYFTKLMLILQNINLELKSALRTKYWFYQTLLYLCFCPWLCILSQFTCNSISDNQPLG